MRSHVTFKTQRFNQTEVHPHFINECCFGEDCIAWLIAELRARGWEDMTDAWQEDWGWQTSGKRDGRRYLYRPVVRKDDYVAQESSRLIDRLFGGRVTPLVAHLAERDRLSEADIAEIEALLKALKP